MDDMSAMWKLDRIQGASWMTSRSRRIISWKQITRGMSTSADKELLIRVSIEKCQRSYRFAAVPLRLKSRCSFLGAWL